STAEDLEGLDVLEALWCKGEHELLDLDRGGQIRAEDGARLERRTERGERSPGLRKIQDAAVEPFSGAADLGDVALAEIQTIGDLPEESLHVADRLGL